MTEFTLQLQDTTKLLLEDQGSAIAVLAGCELFIRFVSRLASEDIPFDAFKQNLISKSRLFVQKADLCRDKIAQVGLQFIRDGQNILIHSYSKVVMMLLCLAHQKGKRFHVYVTEGRPASQGSEAVQYLRGKGIDATLILDAAAGFYMEQMDMVLVGAEGVVENGGLINQIGSFQLSILAKNKHKPFYALAESYKFVRLFPLNQQDLSSTASSSWYLKGCNIPHIREDHPQVDYTPPTGITLLFTDLGVLTPSGVSDELIKFYY